MSINFYIWFSIISFIFNLFLLLGGCGLYVANRKEVGRRNAQIKIWMHTALGVSNSLKRIVANNNAGLYSTTQDAINSTHVAEAGADALFQSLYDERNFEDKDYKKQQQEFRDIIMNSQRSSQANAAPVELAQNNTPAELMTDTTHSEKVSIIRKILKFLHISKK